MLSVCVCVGLLRTMRRCVRGSLACCESKSEQRQWEVEEGTQSTHSLRRRFSISISSFLVFIVGFTSISPSPFFFTGDYSMRAVSNNFERASNKDI